MSCCIPETFNPLCALIAERGGIWGRFTSRVLENPAAWLLHQQGVTSTDKEKPHSAPSLGQEGIQPQPPGAAVAEKVGGLQGEQFSLCTLSSASEPPSCTAPRPDGFVWQPPCSQPCSFVLPTSAPAPHPLICPALTSCTEWDVGSHSLKEGVQEGWTSPPSLVPHRDRSSPTAMLHTPVTPRCSSLPQHQPAQDPTAGRDPRDEERPEERTPQPPCRGAPTPSPG